ncbi:hypothetical protein [Aeromicrobium sp. 179-A 4D2 NHS]|uniref:hypothetical protein n=1 Tax=Aeromicrobium sp. 179-A 4D2 NHS TaxID=3142375 RepID=UPI0039A3F0CE
MGFEDEIEARSARRVRPPRPEADVERFVSLLRAELLDLFEFLDSRLGRQRVKIGSKGFFAKPVYSPDGFLLYRRDNSSLVESKSGLKPSVHLGELELVLPDGHLWKFKHPWPRQNAHPPAYGLVDVADSYRRSGRVVIACKEVYMTGSELRVHDEGWSSEGNDTFHNFLISLAESKLRSTT